MAVEAFCATEWPFPGVVVVRVYNTAALVPLERGEDNAAFVGRVAVVEQVARHASSLPRHDPSHIGASA